VRPTRADGGERGSGGDGLHRASLTGRVEGGAAAIRRGRIGGPRRTAGAAAGTVAGPAEPAGGRAHAGRLTHGVQARRHPRGALAAVRRRVGRPLQPRGGAFRDVVAVVVRSDGVRLREGGRGRGGPPRVGAVGGALLGPPHVPHAGRGDPAGGVPVGVVAFLSTDVGGPRIRPPRRSTGRRWTRRRTTTGRRWTRTPVV